MKLRVHPQRRQGSNAFTTTSSTPTSLPTTNSSLPVTILPLALSRHHRYNPLLLLQLLVIIILSMSSSVVRGGIVVMFVDAADTRSQVRTRSFGDITCTYCYIDSDNAGVNNAMSGLEVSLRDVEFRGGTFYLSPFNFAVLSDVKVLIQGGFSFANSTYTPPTTYISLDLKLGEDSSIIIAGCSFAAPYPASATSAVLLKLQSSFNLGNGALLQIVDSKFRISRASSNTEETFNTHVVDASPTNELYISTSSTFVLARNTVEVVDIQDVIDWQFSCLLVKKLSVSASNVNITNNTIIVRDVTTSPSTGKVEWSVLMALSECKVSGITATLLIDGNYVIWDGFEGGSSTTISLIYVSSSYVLIIFSSGAVLLLNNRVSVENSSVVGLGKEFGLSAFCSSHGQLALQTQGRFEIDNTHFSVSNVSVDGGILRVSMIFILYELIVGNGCSVIVSNCKIDVANIVITTTPKDVALSLITTPTLKIDTIQTTTTAVSLSSSTISVSNIPSSVPTNFINQITVYGLLVSNSAVISSGRVAITDISIRREDSCHVPILVKLIAFEFASVQRIVGTRFTVTNNALVVEGGVGTTSITLVALKSVELATSTAIDISGNTGRINVVGGSAGSGFFYSWVGLGFSGTTTIGINTVQNINDNTLVLDTQDHSNIPSSSITAIWVDFQGTPGVVISSTSVLSVTYNTILATTTGLKSHQEIGVINIDATLQFVGTVTIYKILHNSIDMKYISSAGVDRTTYILKIQQPPTQSIIVNTCGNTIAGRMCLLYRADVTPLHRTPQYCSLYNTDTASPSTYNDKLNIIDCRGTPTTSMSDSVTSEVLPTRTDSRTDTNKATTTHSMHTPSATNPPSQTLTAKTATTTHTRKSTGSLSLTVSEKTETESVFKSSSESHTAPTPPHTASYTQSQEQTPTHRKPPPGTPTSTATNTASQHTTSQTFSAPRTLSANERAHTPSLTTTPRHFTTTWAPPNQTNTPPHTTSHHHPNTVTISTSTTLTMCNYTCHDIVAAMYLPADGTATTPAQAADAYWASYTSGVPRSSTTQYDGCNTVSIPFEATYGGKAARVLVHVDVGSPSQAYLNGSYPTLDTPLPTSLPSSLAATTTSPTFMHGGVIVIDVMRRDANPLDARSGTVGLPRSPFLCVSPSSWTGTPAVRIALLAPPPALTTAERAAIATVSAGSADLQTVAAIGLLRCSPGAEEDVETDAGVRALVPVALSGTCAGAVQGALLAIGVAAVVSVGVTAAVMRVRGVGWSAAAATTRCPGMVIAVWAFMQMGLVVCGARLVTGHDGRVLGAAGVAVGGALPIVCVALTWGVVSRRCYRLAQTPKAAAGRSSVVVRLRAVLLPSFELDGDAYLTSKAYSAVVGRSRRPSCLWSALPAMQPVVMLLVVFVQGPMCSTMLILTGVVLMLLGAVCHMWFRPHRILAANHLQGAAMALNAAVLIVASKLVSDPLDLSAVGANRAIAMIQVALSVSRMGHTVCCVVYMRLYGKTVFQYCDPAYEKMVADSTSSALLPVAPAFEYISPCSQRAHKRMRMCVAEDLLLPTTTGSSTTTTTLMVTVDSPACSPQDDEELLSQHSATPPLSDRSSVDDTPPQPTTTTPQSTTKKVAKKTNIQFSESIISTVVNNHKGYVPMERPYTMLHQSDDDDLDEEDLDVRKSSSLHTSDSDDDLNNLDLDFNDLNNNSIPTLHDDDVPDKSKKRGEVGVVDDLVDL